MKRLLLATIAAAATSTMLAHAQHGPAQPPGPDEHADDRLHGRGPQDLLVGQTRHGHLVVMPDSSVPRPEEDGDRVHTNHLAVLVNPQVVGTAPAGETPASIRSVYSLPATGGANLIAIVTAYHYPTALADFNTFSNQFGLPVETSTIATSSNNKVFQVIYASGKQPATDCGWAQEAALDIEWAHAMAPSAKIVLVEAVNNSYAYLFSAVSKATGIKYVKEISMSWGGAEYAGQTTYDRNLQKSGIVYFAASGDSGGATVYPGTSPYVVSVGGTLINRDATGAFLSETAWSNGGGGNSLYYALPIYQSVIQSVVGPKRAVPDVSLDADPTSGVSVFDSTSCGGNSGWQVFGGTSVSTPMMAGIVNLAGNFYTNTKTELTTIYGSVSLNDVINAANFRDIVAGNTSVSAAVPGWDYITGVGSSLGLAGK